MAKKVSILSLDGGGIKGIIPATILAYVEEQLQKQTGDKDARIADYFDLIAGTSTGGILTCAYLIPDVNNRPKYTAKDALGFYLQRGDEIFDISIWQRMTTGGGVFDEKYSADELEEALYDYFGDVLLSQLLKPSLITAYNIKERKTEFFNMLDVPRKNLDYFIRDIARATSAAPTYFEPARIKSSNGLKVLPLIDGGMFANNPAMCAYAEARSVDFSAVTGNSEKPAYPGAKDMIILSLATGSEKKPYSWKDAKDWGSVKWIKPVIDILMSGNSETVDYELKKIFETVDPHLNSYARIEPFLGRASAEMDEASPQNMALLVEAGETAVKQNKDLLDQWVIKLIENQA